MIDRKTLWISILLILAMTAAGFWRLSLLPDWHHLQLNGPGDSHTASGLFVFIEPASLLFVIATMFVSGWLASGPAGPEESLQPWRRWRGWAVMFCGGITALTQAFMIARSLGIGHAIDRQTIAHVGFAATGMLLVVLGNAVPKMPWLSARFRPFRLDPWQWNRQVRFAGKLLVGMGLFLAIVLPFLPRNLIFPAMISLWLAVFVANLWHRARVKREPSPLS